jgi:hypothetical protein
MFAFKWINLYRYAVGGAVRGQGDVVRGEDEPRRGAVPVKYSADPELETARLQPLSLPLDPS